MRKFEMERVKLSPDADGGASTRRFSPIAPPVAPPLNEGEQQVKGLRWGPQGELIVEYS